jgi:hypothetical protein
MKEIKRKKIMIIEDAIVEYISGKKEIHNAININERVVFSGHMINRYEFIEGRGIPKNNIKNIIGGQKRIVYKKDF